MIDVLGCDGVCGRPDIFLLVKQVESSPFLAYYGMKPGVWALLSKGQLLCRIFIVFLMIYAENIGRPGKEKH